MGNGSDPVVCRRLRWREDYLLTRRTLCLRQEPASCRPLPTLLRPHDPETGEFRVDVRRVHIPTPAFHSGADGDGRRLVADRVLKREIDVLLQK